MILRRFVASIYIQKEAQCFQKMACSTRTLPLLNFKPNLSMDEQQKVLDTINESSFDQLLKFDKSKKRIKNLETWRSKKGPFTSLTDVLEVEGLGVNVLERLCTSILTKNDPKILETMENKEVPNRKTFSKIRKNLLTPNMSDSQITKINSVTGIHIAAMNISWARIDTHSNSLSQWNFLDCTDYPKKMLPNNTFELAQRLTKEIPASDVYIFEAGPNLSAIGQQQQAISLVTYANHLELISMLIALINTSPLHGDSLEESSGYSANKVYFLKSKLAARMFQTLVGSERVSTCTTVSNLLKHSDTNCILPCTPVNIGFELQEEYEEISAVHKDFLGQALILTLAFLDLCVYKNPVSLKSVLGPRRQS